MKPIDIFDVFICHASEDKKSVATPLANSLSKSGLKVWYDDFSLKLGDPLRESIDKGLAQSRYGVVVLSPNFFKKNWPKAELEGLFAKQMSGGKSILPVWHEVTHEDLLGYSPLLVNIKAAKTADGLDRIVEHILDVVESDLSHRSKNGLTLVVSPISLRLYDQGWSLKTPVIVSNRSEQPLYTVVVKVTLQSQGDQIKSESLEISVPNKTTTLQGKFGPYAVSTDWFGFNCLDSKKQETIGIVFHTIEPKQAGGSSFPVRFP